MSNWFDQIDTPLNACSIETFVPLLEEDYLLGPIVRNNCDSDTTTSHLNDHVTPLIIGCYQLNESCTVGSAPKTDDTSQSKPSEDDAVDGEDACVETSARSGELRLYMISSTKIKPAELSTTESLKNSKAHHDEPVRFRDASCVVKMESGVLDGKWRKRGRANRTTRSVNCHESTPLFASACASGKIHLHSLEKDRNTKEWNLVHLASSTDQSPSEELPLCLSLAWNDFTDTDCNDDAGRSEPDQLVSSYSNGKVALHRVSAKSRALSDETCDCVGDGLDNSVCIEETHRWDAHQMFGCPSEVWTCSFLRDSVNVVLSGADDCSLKIWDIRQTQRPMHKIGDSEFSAGVTAISPHPSCGNLFAAGSYDEIVRIYDQRKLDDPIVRFPVGGGVWRIKWHPSSRGKMLIAAMHGGCRVVNIHALDSTNYCVGTDHHTGVVVLSEFTAHESMAYGADWLCFDDLCCDEAVASCSFYDRKAFLWDPYHQPP